MERAGQCPPAVLMDPADQQFADEIAQLWQSTQKGASSSLSEKVLTFVLLSVAVALGNALVVLLKESVDTRRSPTGDGRRKSVGQVA